MVTARDTSVEHRKQYPYTFDLRHLFGNFKQAPSGDI